MPFALLTAVTIAFPSEGMRLPALSRCYAIGAADGSETGLVLRVSSLAATNDPPRQLSVPVCRTGAWGVLLDVWPGTNLIEVGSLRRRFVVAEPATNAVSAATAAVTNGLPKAAEGASGSAVRAAGMPTNRTVLAVQRPPTGGKAYPKLPYAADTAKPHPSGRPPSEIVLVIDAGHGGRDTGALSPHGWQEKDANLRLAKSVAHKLREKGFAVKMTREDDSFPALYDRPKVAHEANADAFVSIHHNAPGYESDPTRIRYQSVYAWNAIGEGLASAIAARLTAARPDLPSKGVLHANFAVTRNPEIPSCLVEADFVTHPEGERASWDETERERAAVAIADGISDWAR